MVVLGVVEEIDGWGGFFEEVVCGFLYIIVQVICGLNQNEWGMVLF